MVKVNGKKGFAVGTNKKRITQAGSGVATRQRPTSQFGNPKRASGVPKVNLDRGAREYARLLADPCNGPLVAGPGPGLGGGIITRFETDFIAFAGAGITSGYLIFSPADANSVAGAGALDTTASAGTTITGPGKTFLDAQASAHRCLSACMQVYWPGNELNRQGLIGMGYGTGQLYTDVLPVANGGRGLSNTAANVRASNFHVERTPNGMVELKFKPTQADMNWLPTEKESAQNQPELDARTTMTLSATGLPAATGIRIRLVAVYEWIPKISTGAGLVTTVGHSPPTYNTMNDILQALDRTGRWFLKTVWDNREYIGEFAGAMAAITMV